jgi:hypothetical protein
VAEHRRPSVVGQRQLAVEPDPPAGPAPPPPPPPETPSPPTAAYGPVVSSSDALWERRLRWLRAREKFEASATRPPPSEEPPK